MLLWLLLVAGRQDAYCLWLETGLFLLQDKFFKHSHINITEHMHKKPPYSPKIACEWVSNEKGFNCVTSLLSMSSWDSAHLYMMLSMSSWDSAHLYMMLSRSSWDSAHLYMMLSRSSWDSAHLYMMLSRSSWDSAHLYMMLSRSSWDSAHLYMMLSRSSWDSAHLYSISHIMPMQFCCPLCCSVYIILSKRFMIFRLQVLIND